VQLVAKNSGFLLLSQFTNKGLDFLSALFVLRALGPEGNGQFGQLDRDRQARDFGARQGQFGGRGDFGGGGGFRSGGERRFR